MSFRRKLRSISTCYSRDIKIFWIESWNLIEERVGLIERRNGRQMTAKTWWLINPRCVSGVIREAGKVAGRKSLNPSALLYRAQEKARERDSETSLVGYALLHPRNAVSLFSRDRVLSLWSNNQALTFPSNRVSSYPFLLIVIRIRLYKILVDLKTCGWEFPTVSKHLIVSVIMNNYEYFNREIIPRSIE